MAVTLGRQPRRVGPGGREPRLALPAPTRLDLSRYRDAVLAAGPALYWRLDDPSGTIAHDSSGNARDGTYVGGPALNQAGGLLNDPDTAVGLDGSTEYVSSTYAPFIGGSQRTFVGLAYRNTSTTNDTLFAGDVGGGVAPALRLASGGNDVVWVLQGVSALTWTGAWPGNAQWVHWAFTYNDATRDAELFVNGASQGVQSFISANYNAAPGNFKAGARATVTDPFDGNLDEPAAFERILTATEIANLATIAVGTVFDTATTGGAVGQGQAAVGAVAAQVIGDSVSGGNPPGPSAAQVIGGAVAQGRAASALASQVIGGANAGAPSPGAGASTPIGGGQGGGQGAAALASQVIGASVAGGPTPSALASAVVLAGGAVGGAQVPVPTVAVPQGGVVAQGRAAAVAAAQVIGGAIAQGRPANALASAVIGGAGAGGVPAGAAVSQVVGGAIAQGRAAGAIANQVIGGAIAGGFAPGVTSTVDFPPAGVAAAGGFGPGAAAGQVAGGGVSGGQGATASTVVSSGGAVAGARPAGANVPIPIGPAVAGGPDQTAFVVAPVTPGGAVAGVYAPGAYIPASHVIGGAVADGIGPVGALAGVEPGFAIASGYVPSEVSEGGVGHISHDGAGHVVPAGPGHISGARAGTVSGNGAGDVDRVPAGHVRP